MKNLVKKWELQKSFFIPEAVKLGPTYSYLLLHTPRQLLFAYARYKFAARLIGEFPKVDILELGCNEGIGTLLLAEYGHSVTAVDFDQKAVQWAKKNLGKKKNISYKYGDFLGKIYGEFGVAVLIDVIEHIPQNREKELLETITGNLRDDGYCIVGTPNAAASKHSSATSRAGHVNLFSAKALKVLMGKYFKNVFIFSMNDEVMHTGFYPMSHYLFALACGKK